MIYIFNKNITLLIFELHEIFYYDKVCPRGLKCREPGDTEEILIFKKGLNYDVMSFMFKCYF